MSLLLLQSDFGLFLGRMHPLVVHLPIGFLFLAGIFYYFGRKTKYSYLKLALPMVLGLSALSAVGASFLGWLLANAGGYDETTLFLHRWMGIGIAVISVVAWLWSIGRIGGNKGLPAWLIGIMVGLLFLTGHQGGNLTHGKGYLLNYAPGFIQKLFGADTGEKATFADFPESPDSTLVFGHLLQQTMDQKCVSCHNDETQRGDLNMANVEALLKGGDGGPVLVKGEALKSELFHRVTMDPNSRKFMPPKGVSMTYQEVRLLDYWIENGMSFDMAITDKAIPADIKSIIEDHYGVSTKKIPYVERRKIDPAPEAAIAKAQAAGFTVNALASQNNFIDVSFRGDLTKDKLAALSGIKEQLTWLNLGRTGLQDDWMSILSEFPNLTRLRLEQNEIGNAGLEHLKELAHLESLNLYGTQVGDEGLSALENIKSLRKLFLWQTKATSTGAEALKSKLPGLQVDMGIELVEKVN